MNEALDPHATVIAEDTAHDMRQVEYEIGAAEQSMERLFDLLLKRLDEADIQLVGMRKLVELKREQAQHERNEAKTYADTFLEQLGSVTLLLAKIGDGIDGIPGNGAANGHDR